MLVWRGTRATAKEWKGLVGLIKEEVAASKQIEALLRGTGGRYRTVRRLFVPT
jgi:hypothetical protein